MLDAIMRAELPSSLKGTLMSLAFHENKEGQWVWPRLETIAGESGLNRKTVVKSLTELIQRGLVKREPRVGTSSQYQLQTQPIFGLTRFRADPNMGQGATQIRVDTQPKNGSLTSPGDPSKNGSTPETLSPPWRGDALRLLKAVRPGHSPDLHDLEYLKLAAGGDRKAWRSFCGTMEQRTKHFLAAVPREEQETA